MNKFIVRLFFFTLTAAFAGEIIIRAFKLTPEIPERYTDKSGIQRYKHNQSGYYTKARSKWVVNDFGWLGVSDTTKDIRVSIIGDSYIENIMNPISCNQGSILKSYFPNVSFFEAGRSGVSFIEAMEISKILDSEISPRIHLLYLSNKDFYESISTIARYENVVQIDLPNKRILKTDLGLSKIKKLLYSSKLLYYLYLRFPIFVSKQNLGEVSGSSESKAGFDDSTFTSLFEYCSRNYNSERIVFVFHPGIQKQFILLSEKYHFKTISLNSDGDKSWVMTSNDDHWSCYGHNQVAKQIKMHLLEFLHPVIEP